MTEIQTRAGGLRLPEGLRKDGRLRGTLLTAAKARKAHYKTFVLDHAKRVGFGQWHCAVSCV